MTIYAQDEGKKREQAVQEKNTLILGDGGRTFVRNANQFMLVSNLINNADDGN